MPAEPPPPPRTLVCVKVDTLGDLILFTPTLQTIRNTWADTRIVVVIREAYAEIGPLLAGNVEWLTTSLDPFARGPDDDPPELDRLRREIAAVGADVLVAATSRRNWLEIVLAADCGAQRRLALGAATEDEFFATQLRVRFGLDARIAFNEHAEGARDEPDWHRNAAIADRLLGVTVSRVPPRIQLGKAARDRIGAQLGRWNLQPGGYVACAAAGFAHVSLKTWPAERFGAVLKQVRNRHGLRTLLIGKDSERACLEQVAGAAGGDAAIWLGGSLIDMAALIAESALFVGNDTGAMHLAAALDVPVVAVFGGGTWPRFVPAAHRGAAVVHPLPCFGCGWDCAFGDAPCIREIRVEDLLSSVDLAITGRHGEGFAIRTVGHIAAETRELMGKAAERYRQARRDHLARQHKLEELTDLDREKDFAIREKEASIHEKEASIHEKEASIHEKEASIHEKEAAVLAAEGSMRIKEASIFEKENEINSKEAEIAALKAVCDERERLIFDLDGQVKQLKAYAATIEANQKQFERSLDELPPEQADAAKTIGGQAIHIRNLEALLILRDNAISELEASAANRAAGLGDLEQAKHYARLLSEKEAVIRELHRSCQERESVIRRLAADSTTLGARAGKLWSAARAFAREKLKRPAGRWLYRRIVERYWMQIGLLAQYPPRPLEWDARLNSWFPRTVELNTLPQIGIVTPSFGQERFIERTLLSVLDQGFVKLRYVVQDGGSRDRTMDIVKRHAGRLRHWASSPDNGQSDAIRRGFGQILGELRPEDLMGWLNSDDMLAPGALRFVADYFARHPKVDVIYGHRIIIDDEDREIGRWIMPRHDPATLEWIDYVPQETLFWRKRAWDLVGGVDPSFHFALDWDLIARFQQAGFMIVRVPYFLGAFRVHAEQKTTVSLNTTGADEMRRVRARFHGDRIEAPAEIERLERRTRLRGAMTARLCALGIRW